MAWAKKGLDVGYRQDRSYHREHIGQTPLMSDSVGDVVRNAVDDDPGSAPLHRLIHGTAEATGIVGNVERVLHVSGLPPATGCRFHRSSVGTTTALSLEDGTEVVVKAFQPTWTDAFLTGIRDVQERLWRHGLACPQPLAGPITCGAGLASVETFLEDPGEPEQFGDAERAASAVGLAELVGAAGLDVRLRAHPLRHHPSGKRYPTPHSPIFDFDATAEGAEWIDDFADLGRAHMAEGPEVVAHTDWSARNVRLAAGGVLAFYDLDSLALVSLPTALGQAAATWRALGEEGEPIAPSIDEIDDWLDCYPEELNGAERRAALAASLWTLAYTARCEHAIDPDEARFRRARPRLRAEGDRYRSRLTAGRPALGVDR